MALNVEQLDLPVPCFFQEVMRVCTAAESSLLLHLLASSFRVAPQPENRVICLAEWVPLSNREAAGEARCSVNTAGKALRRMETLGILEGRQGEQSREYRLAFENWDSVAAAGS
jgi:predicted transcriptional regulator